MKIAYCASEAAPFIKTGGLGDVAQALPDALSKLPGVEVLVFLPYYKRIKENPAVEVEKITSFEVKLAWRRQYCGVLRLKSPRRKWKVYFLDNEYYFGRDAIYGEGDDGERFAFFSRAIPEALVRLGEQVDILHCNDWQTALVPVFLRAFYPEKPEKVKTVFTIHNVEYQGKADAFFFDDTLGLPEEFRNALTFDGGCNFMKAAILKADAVTTVSESYARELRYPYYAHGLAGILEDHAFKLSGIVNGFDPACADPATDPNLVQNYTVGDFWEGKAANKRALQKELGLPQNPSAALCGMVSRLVPHKGTALLCGILEELAKFDIQLVILGTGERETEAALSAFADKYPEKISVNLRFDPALASRIYAASDLYLMPSKSEPCGLSQLIAMRYGSIPVVNETGGLRDTVTPFREDTLEGVGFTFQTFTEWDFLDAIRRALGVWGRGGAPFEKLVQNAMQRDSSWKKPAAQTLSLYKNLF